MKIATLGVFGWMMSSTMAFAPSLYENGSRLSSMEMVKESSRSEFLSVMGAAVMLGGNVLPANAAKYGSFGADSPNVLDPKTAIVDSDILASTSVQASISSVKKYLSSVQGMQAVLKQDSQANIGPSIRNDLDFVALRSDLNTLNSAFDEDTQRGTDRLIRIILQDITELETANKQKDGVARSERRLAIMNGKLEKLNQAFSDYLAFI